ncbi:alpha-glucuronidase family glycosyl hydrolase [Galbibacter sp. EGI 63066]|uniref:alpha-glucuronidase family glycosyl hydrolase n=1 Tax=Galbibacter sp. EGI 63066 TaxID=2993559 RepID=UPI002248838D|nr:alpha-glucuronidase family glycosyl hydrolase [Galbibacter sp. EGI 63066]MCX2680249.1 alpha-glucuronidase family glycosyl hydrolase [Galbibacter sp. EGI 63066]
MHKKTAFFTTILLLCVSLSFANGYELWLKYRKIQNKTLLTSYRNSIQSIYHETGSETLEISKKELTRGLSALLDTAVPFVNSSSEAHTLVVGTIDHLDAEIQNQIEKSVLILKKDGFLITSHENNIIITAKSDLGVLYGTFYFLRQLQTQRSIEDIHQLEIPKTDIRILNHWDNLDRSVERGYAGASIWKWHRLPGYIDQRYIDYARANASIGINGTVLTNVNANALVLTPHYIEKVKALADVFRPYGIKVYLTARFSAPIEIGELSTADPLDPEVQQWWKDKADEIYKAIPDFGGFLVKANSEGQPGPQNYGRSHVDGANMLAETVAPHNGVVMWRAFVYSEHDATDRAKQAYSEFVPMDGKFKDNVLIQVKNGPIDFQPREPFHPMFGAMPKTPLMMEFQITQEYLGFSTHLVFLPKLYEEVLDADTYQHGKGSTVAKVIDGTLDDKKITGMAGVANIGSDINWTGHPFGQANWYGYGRLAWDPYLSSEKIAEEWLRLTYSNDEDFVTPMTDLMIKSREAVVNYMTPLGLHHLMDTGHHYGPGPWVGNLSRPEWNPTYYHKADAEGIGFDRTPTGSDATSQYASEVATMFNELETCPETYLLWFHHLSWDYKLKNGKTLWDNLGLKYQEGVDQVEGMQAAWQKMKPFITSNQFKEVNMLLKIQLKEAKWWRDASMLYFQTFSKREFPKEMEKPTKTLDYYQSLKFPYAPGIRPQWD